MGKASRDKGKRGEREIVNLLKDLWEAHRAKRTSQVDGTLSADVIDGLFDRYSERVQWHIEVKRYAKLPALLRNWLQQAKEDADGLGYLVLFREDGGKWYLTMELDWSPEFALDLAAQLSTS